MGIHASNNVSQFAHQENEPCVDQHYDYDQYVIMDEHRIVEKFDMDYDNEHNGESMWSRARKRFLQIFNEEKRPVKLVGRVFN